MRIIDITAELNEDIRTYQDDPRVRIEPHATIRDKGYSCTRIHLGSHSGTHVDAPSHFLEDGATVTDLPLNVLIGQCYVVDVENFKIEPQARRILVKGCSDREHTINVRQAQALLDAGIRLLGTDSLSIGNDEVHRLLLSNDCIILEVLELGGVRPGKYTLCALPMKIDCDGAPVRACLLEQRTGGQ